MAFDELSNRVKPEIGSRIIGGDLYAVAITPSCSSFPSW